MMHYRAHKLGRDGFAYIPIANERSAFVQTAEFNPEQMLRILYLNSDFQWVYARHNPETLCWTVTEFEPKKLNVGACANHNDVLCNMRASSNFVNVYKQALRMEKPRFHMFGRWVNMFYDAPVLDDVELSEPTVRPPVIFTGPL